MSCLREVQTISKSPDILPMPSLTRLTTGGVLNPTKNTTNTSHNELLHQEPLQPPLEPREPLNKPPQNLELDTVNTLCTGTLTCEEPLRATVVRHTCYEVAL